MPQEKKKISEVAIEYPDGTQEDAVIYIPISQVDQLQQKLNELSSQIQEAQIYWEDKR